MKTEDGRVHQSGGIWDVAGLRLGHLPVERRRHQDDDRDHAPLGQNKVDGVTEGELACTLAA